MGFFKKLFGSGPRSAEECFRRGIAHGDKGEWDAAIREFTQAINLDPRYIDAYCARGVMYDDRGDFGQAIADFSKAIQLDPANAVAYGNRGIAHSDKGDLDEAIADYTEAIRLDPGSTAAHCLRGDIHFRRGEWDQAISDYDQAIRLDPTYSSAYTSRSGAYLNRGEYDRAIADASEAIRLDPTDAMAYSNRGGAWGRQGEHDQAIADCSEAIRLNPGCAEAYRNRGSAHSDRGARAEAEADFARAKELGLEPEQPDTDQARQWWEKGRGYVGRGEYDEGIACFGKSLDLAPGDTANYIERGNAYLLKGDADAAIADLTEFIRLNPESAAARWAPPHRTLEAEESGGVTVVTFTEDKVLDEESIQDIREQLLSLVDGLGRKEVALNFANVSHMSSAALGMLVALSKKLNVAGGRLALCNLAPAIHEVLTITKLDKLFRIGPLPVKEGPGGSSSPAAVRPAPPSAADFLESHRWRHVSAVAYTNRASAYGCKGNHDAAIADCTEAIRLYPTFAGAYVNRGGAYAGKEDYQRAVADYTELIRLQPGQAGEAKAYAERAKAYRALGDEDRAAMDERRMSACDCSARAEAHLAAGQVDQAVAAYTEAIRLDPTSERYAARARAFQAKGDCGRAIADYGEAIRLEPRDAGLYLMRAGIYRATGDEALAAGDESTLEELLE